MTETPQTYGRWTVVKDASPAQRRPSAPTQRARMVVRCVCGTQQTVWVEDLDGGRSTGCASRRCMVRAAVVDELMPRLSNWLGGPEGERLFADLQKQLARWQVEARREDHDDGWQVTAGRSRTSEDGVESDDTSESDSAP